MRTISHTSQESLDYLTSQWQIICKLSYHVESKVAWNLKRDTVNMFLPVLFFVGFWKCELNPIWFENNFQDDALSAVGILWTWHIPAAMTKHTKTLLHLPVLTRWIIPSRHSRSQKLPGKIPWLFFLIRNLDGRNLKYNHNYNVIYRYNITPQSKVRYHDEVSLNAKAWNGRVICCWLAETLPLAARGVPVGYDEGRLSLVCYALILGRST